MRCRRTRRLRIGLEARWLAPFHNGVLCDLPFEGLAVMMDHFVGNMSSCSSASYINFMMRST